MRRLAASQPPGHPPFLEDPFNEKPPAPGTARTMETIAEEAKRSSTDNSLQLLIRPRNNSLVMCYLVLRRIPQASIRENTAAFL
jgi:hypothetical protein